MTKDSAKSGPRRDCPCQCQLRSEASAARNEFGDGYKRLAHMGPRKRLVMLEQLIEMFVHAAHT